MQQIPRLKRKTALERGPVDPDSLTAALFWDRLTPPDPIDQPGAPAPEAPTEEKGGKGSGNFRHAGRPGQRGGSAAASAGPAAGARKPKGPHYQSGQVYRKVAPAVLAKKLQDMPEELSPFLTKYSAQEYKEMRARCYVSGSGKSGYAIKPDGDIISVFSQPGAHEGKSAIKSAIENGGTKLDCFDGFLAQQFYPQFGFKPYERWTWDDQYMPAGWDKNKYDSPDVVLMSLGGD